MRYELVEDERNHTEAFPRMYRTTKARFTTLSYWILIAAASLYAKGVL